MRKIKYMIGIIIGIFIFSGMLFIINDINRKNIAVPIEIHEENTVLTEAVDLPRTYNVYDAQITFDSSLSTFKGIETIKYVHEFQTPTKQIVIRLFANEGKTLEDTETFDYNTPKEIDVSTVKISGQDVAFRQRETSLTIYLKEPLSYEDKIELNLEFSGSMYPTSGDYNERSKMVVAKSILPQLAPFKEDEGWIINERRGADHFVYAEPADYHVSILSRKFVVATGTLVSKEEEANEYHNYIFSAKRVRDFGLYIGEELSAKEYKLPNDKTLIIHTNKMVDMDRLVEQAVKVFDYYSSILGTYPYDQFTIVDNSGINDIISYPMLMLCDFEDMNKVYNNMYLNIGKQWIPYILCNEPKVNNWINTGLEMYISRRAEESISRISNRVGYELNNYNQNIEKLTEQEKAYINAVLKPMQMLVRVENYLGEEAWHAKLRQYYKGSAFETTPNSELMMSIIEDYGSATQFIDEEMISY